MASRGSFWPPLIDSLMLARTLASGRPARCITDSRLASGCAASCGARAVMQASMPAVAAWQRASVAASPL